MKPLFFVLSVFFTLSFSECIIAQTSSKDPVYIEMISNPSKTRNYTIGVYPKSYQYDADKKHSYLTMKIKNSASEPLSWSENNRIIVVLANYELAYNYLTAAENGEYACGYTIQPDVVHTQILCFNREFSTSDIKSVYLEVGDSFFQLVYFKNDD